MALASEGWGAGCPGATAGDKPQPYIFLCGRCSWFPDCRFFRAAMVRGLPTHEGFLKPALRWRWPRRDRGRDARRPRLGTSPSPTFFSVGIVPRFPIAVFARGYGSWNTHPRRLSKAGPTVELASAGRRTMRLGPAAWEGPAAGDKPQRYMVVFRLPETVASTMVVGVAGPCRDLITLNAVSGHGRAPSAPTNWFSGCLRCVWSICG